MAVKEIIPFNFDDTYSYIETKFSDRGYDIEEGSNTMQLVTAMSYLVSMLNANTAVNINETLLSQARKRTMILEDARILGYEIEHIQSYKYKFSLNFNALDTYSINKYTSFSSGDYFYYYMGDTIAEFTVSDITTIHYYNNEITEEQTIALAATLLADWEDDYGCAWDDDLGWTVFNDDLATYVAPEITEVTPEGDTARSLSGDYWTLNSPSTEYYVWNQLGLQEVNTLTCGAASNTDMTGTKEVNTVIAEADVADSLDGQCFHFWALDGNNGLDTEYYCYFDNDDAHAVGDPVESGTEIKVVIVTGDTATAVATAVRAAITASDADVTVSGSGANIIITGNYFGVSTAASDGTATTGWASFTRTTTGVDIIAGDYLIFYTGLTASAIKYYVWFNATGGSAAGTAPSIDPAVASATGIQVDHAFDADSTAMGTALRAAIEAQIGATGDASAIISGATTDAIITDALYGVGTIAETGSAPSGFSVARTVTGILGSTDPAVTDKTGIQVDFLENTLSGDVALATSNAINAETDFSTSITAGLAQTITIIAEANTSSSLDGLYFFISKPSGTYHVWFDCSGSTSDPDPGDSTGIEVTLTTDDTAQEVSDLIVTAVDAVTGFGATNESGATPTITIVNDDVGASLIGDAGTTAWSDPITTVTGLSRVITITNTVDGFVVDSADYNTGWSSAWTITQQGSDLGDAAANVTAALVNISSTNTLKEYVGLIKQIEVSEGILYKYTDSANSSTLTQIIESTTEIDADTLVETTTIPYYIDVPFSNIEENGLHVFLTYIDEAGVQHIKEEWERSNSFMIDSDTELIKQYVRLDSIEFKTPRIYFKLGEIGNELRVGTYVYINALETSGTLGEITETPTPASLVCEIMEYSLSSTGTVEESSESIKENAPLFHNTANRIITKPDYEAFCNRQTTVKYSDVWDGHYEYPQLAGYIWFSFYPSSVTRNLTPVDSTTNASYLMDDLSDRDNWNMEDTEIDDVFDYLENFKVPTLIFQHRQPVYFNFNYDIEIIKYNAALTYKEQHTTIFDVVDDYFTGSSSVTGVETFKFEYFNSNLTKRIDTALTDVTGVNITLTNTIEITDKNINDEDSPNEQVCFHLGLAYEDTIVDGVITTANLPDIETENLAGGSDTLSVDFGDPTETTISGGTLTEYPVLREAVEVGVYRVFDVLDPDIEVILWINSSGGYAISGGLEESELIATLELDVVYPSSNIKFSRNTIPRLKTVNFV